MQPLDPEAVRFIRETAESERYAVYLRDLLVELVSLNTAADSDFAATAVREQRLFDRIEREVLAATDGQAAVERPPIDPAIESDPEYARPGYAADEAGKVPGAATVYRDRGNLVAIMPATAEPGLILHAHVDVVPPWFPGTLEGGRVKGRGACDNKAQVAVFLAQMRLLHELEEKLGRRASRGQVYQFAIEEEIGGNGSISLVRDPRFAKLPVLMGESTDLVPYCAHRGCVYYRCRLSIGENPDATALELFPFVVLALEAEGRKIKRETSTPGFSDAHVQTNHGILGIYGLHPGNVCDHVAVELVARTNANPDRMAMKLTQLFDEAIVEYASRYGDKTREIDPATGRPRLARHFQVKLLPSTNTQNFRIDIWGVSGHMGAVAQCDNAITKAALLFGGLLKVAGKYQGIQAWGRLADWSAEESGRSVILEGGQGFTPSHRMADVQARMAAAARDAVQKYCKLRHRRFDESMVQMTFDRLHNDAYSDPPTIAPMAALRAACETLGHRLPETRAWETSCDARIYHHKGHPVAIFGAGKLHLAHSDSEFVTIPDLQKALSITALATWWLVQG